MSVGAAGAVLFILAGYGVVYLIGAPLWHAFVRKPMATRTRGLR